MESGVLNHGLKDNEGTARALLKEMYRVCRLGVAFNLTTDYVDYRDEYLYYYSPEEVFSFCRSLSRFVTLRHDYPLYEFTVYIYRHAIRHTQEVFAHAVSSSGIFPYKMEG